MCIALKGKGKPNERGDSNRTRKREGERKKKKGECQEGAPEREKTGKNTMQELESSGEGGRQQKKSESI